MALCLASSLVIHQGFFPYDQLVRYKWWYRNGYMSSIGECFDIGASIKRSLLEFEIRQYDFAEKYNIPRERVDYLTSSQVTGKFNLLCSDKDVAGNGALMRIAPVPLFFHHHPKYAVHYSDISTRVTHNDPRAYDACRYYSALIVAALQNETKSALLNNDFYQNHIQWFNSKPLHPEIMKVAQGSYKKQGGYDEGIRGTGYVVHSLEAALWAFWSDGDSFENGVLAAINLGDDTDTTAAIYGQLAGAYYGYNRLPNKWLNNLYGKGFIECLSKWIVFEGERWSPEKRPPLTTTTSIVQQQANVTTSVSNKQHLYSNTNTSASQSNSQKIAQTHSTRNQGFTSERFPQATTGEEQNRPKKQTSYLAVPNNTPGALKQTNSYHEDDTSRPRCPSKNEMHSPNLPPLQHRPSATVSKRKNFIFD
ncbi:unnamed protein product [Rotaria sp. Silwood2]|nr:unnamed protein product [Rotaria sp. Silwood2]